jgi:aspartyl-tRNA(Asn)/glutamyl-tRNA(Gln) amidotransferase subunit C
MMPIMTTDEVKHLAKLARIELTPEEVAAFTLEMSAILAYVGKVQELVGDEVDAVPTVGDRYNIFRQDVVTNAADAYTGDILAEMPETQGRYLAVKKILAVE